MSVSVPLTLNTIMFFIENINYVFFVLFRSATDSDVSNIGNRILDTEHENLKHHNVVTFIIIQTSWQRGRHAIL